MTALRFVLPLVALLLAAPPAAAADATIACRRLELEGFERVRRSVVEEILPRPLPAELLASEIAELERRLWSLAIFDDVEVKATGDALRVRVREKWTLVPSIDAASSKTLRDSYVYGNLVEVNFAGRAQELGAYAAYAERAVSAEVWWGEHQAASRRLTFEGGLFWVGSGLSFEDAPFAWERRRTGARAAVRLPFAYGTRVRVAALLAGYRETLEGFGPDPLDDGTAGSLGLRVVWDRYTWNDVVPSGLRLSAEATAGAFARDDARRAGARHAGFAQLLAAVPFGSRVVLTGEAVGEAVAPGDPDHSALLGSVPGYRFSVGALGGVRGLPDNLLRNAAHAYANVELRAALQLAPRWYLQGVLFADAAVYARMDARGEVLRPESALSTGVGVRLLPTAIAALVPRLDAGRVQLGREAFFVAFGLSQYF